MWRSQIYSLIQHLDLCHKIFGLFHLHTKVGGRFFSSQREHEGHLQKISRGTVRCQCCMSDKPSWTSVKVNVLSAEWHMMKPHHVLGRECVMCVQGKKTSPESFLNFFFQGVRPSNSSVALLVLPGKMIKPQTVYKDGWCISPSTITAAIRGCSCGGELLLIHRPEQWRVRLSCQSWRCTPFFKTNYIK